MKNSVKLITIFLLFVFIAACSPFKMGSSGERVVLIKTTEGNIKLKLYNETPLHRDNFVKLVKAKFYDDILFHRVIDEFMIQAGDPDSKKAEPGTKLGSGSVGYTVPAEFRTPKLYHKKGALAAARTGDSVNPEKASSGSQFYIVVGKTYNDNQLDQLEENKTRRIGAANNDSTYMFSQQVREDYKIFGGTPQLDADYTVFGEIISGLGVVEKISRVETDSADRPENDVRILKARLVRR